MKQIYEQAEKVLVWLGKPENGNNNKLAFKKMQHFRKLYLNDFMKAHPYRPLCELFPNFDRPTKIAVVWNQQL